MNSVVRHVLLSLGFVSLYFVLNLPGTILISHLGITTWYPANGLVFALLFAVSPWYGLLVAVSDSLAGVIIYHQPLLSYSETIGAMAVASFYTMAAIILRGPLKVNSSLNRGKDVACYIFLVTAAALLSTAVGVGLLIADRSIPSAEFWSTSVNWFIGDEIGLLCLAPFLLIHVFPHLQLQQRETRISLLQRAKRWTADQIQREVKVIPLLETVGQGSALLAVLWVIFGPRWGHRELLYLSFIPILWMAMAQGVRRAVSGILALNFGIIVAMHVFPPPSSLLDRVGILMLVISATGLVVGSAVSERHKIATELNERTTYLNALIENNPLGIAVLNRTGAVEMANPAFTNLFQRKPGELIGASLDALLSNIDSPDDFSWFAEIVGGNRLRRTAQTHGKAEKLFDLELQGVPLAIGSEVRGAYIICRDISDQVRASKAEREHTEALNQLVKELELQTEQMTLLNEMAGLLECCANTEEACSVVDRFAGKLFPEAVSGALYTFRASRNLIEEVLSWGSRQACHPTFTPENCWALRRGQGHWSNPIRSVVCEHLTEMPEGEYLCLPMVAQGETLGVLQLHFPGTDKERVELKTGRQRLGATVAAQIALSLASVQSREKLRDQSIRDPLTGLFNRRFMEASLDRELIRARRKNQSLSVLFLDIDHFKRFNDTFGHEAGDVVLQATADLLRKFFRGDDIACRWGGEEFAIILPDSTPPHAATRANALRDEIKNLALRHRGVALAPITISVGIAAFPEDAETAGDLFSIADRCLYQSKSAGRDCITVARQG